MRTVNRKEELLECALTLFSEKGYESTGINEIVQQVGVTKPTLYYFFQSKEGVFQEILDRYYSDFNEKLKASAVYVPNPASYENDVLPTLLEIARAYFSFAQRNKKFYMLILSLAFAPPNAQTTVLITPFDTAQYEILTACFEQIANVHENLKGRESLCARHFSAMLNANIGFWYHGNGELDEEKARLVVKQFMHGIFS